MKVVILAGGLGTRISEESHLRPKPMIEIGDAPILWHIMKYYSGFGFNDFIICCGYKGYIIKEYFANYFLHRSDITFDFSNGENITVHNNVAEPWRVSVIDTGINTQTGGRIKRVRDYVGNEAFMMTYGDGLSNVDIHALLEQHKRTGCVTTLTAIQPSARWGILALTEDKNRVVGFREKAQADVDWINAGFMVMEHKALNYIDGDNAVFEQKPLERMSEEGKLGVYKHKGFWQCMDTQRDKGVLEDLWNRGKAPWKTW